jgi:hypothetical protein
LDIDTAGEVMERLGKLEERGQPIRKQPWIARVTKGGWGMKDRDP